MPRGPIAQSVEQVAFNHWVAGSSPARITNFFNLQIAKQAFRACFFIHYKHNAANCLTDKYSKILFRLA